MSAEFLRKYEPGADLVQIIDYAIKPGEGRFDQDYQAKADLSDFKGRSRSLNRLLNPVGTLIRQGDGGQEGVA